MKALPLMESEKYFRPLYVLSNVWQNMGWNAIIYIAALAGVDPQLHESAYIDGANRYQCVWYINLPCIMPTVVIMLILNSFLSNYVNDPDASLGFYAIAPCVLFVCVLSAFRGFIQGQHNMLPTAVSQLIEQVGKVFVSLPLAYIGVHIYNSRAMGAAGALLGLTIAEGAALLYMIIRFYIKKKDYNSLIQSFSGQSMESRELLRRLVLISIPITINACIIPLSNFIDSSMMTRRMMDAGLSWEAADMAYGAFQSVVIRFINIPTALALAIAMNIVPAVSARKAEPYPSPQARSSSLRVPRGTSPSSVS